jgi:hypothetical protein
MVGANRKTGITAQAADCKPLRLRFGGEAFWVMAPGAAQWATLEEDRGTDARAILSGKALKVQDASGQGHHRI